MFLGFKTSLPWGDILRCCHGYSSIWSGFIILLCFWNIELCIFRVDPLHALYIPLVVEKMHFLIKCTFLLLFVLLLPLFILGRGCWGELLLSQWCPGCCISKILEPNCMGEAGSSWAELNSVSRFEAVKSNPFLSSTAAEIPSKLA